MGNCVKLLNVYGRLPILSRARGSLRTFARFLSQIHTRGSSVVLWRIQIHKNQSREGLQMWIKTIICEEFSTNVFHWLITNFHNPLNQVLQSITDGVCQFMWELFLTFYICENWNDVFLLKSVVMWSFCDTAGVL